MLVGRRRLDRGAGCPLPPLRRRHHVQAPRSAALQPGAAAGPGVGVAPVVPASGRPPGAAGRCAGPAAPPAAPAGGWGREPLPDLHPVARWQQL